MQGFVATCAVCMSASCFILFTRGILFLLDTTCVCADVIGIFTLYRLFLFFIRAENKCNTNLNCTNRLVVFNLIVRKSRICRNSSNFSFQDPYLASRFLQNTVHLFHRKTLQWTFYTRCRFFCNLHHRKFEVSFLNVGQHALQQ